MTSPDLALLADYIPAWTQAQRDALDAWRQGDVFACPSLAWSTATDRDDSITGLAAPSGGIQVWPATQPKYAIITSQTCDIAAEGPGARHPFIQVSPVAPAGKVSKQRWDELTSWSIVDRVGLTGSSFRAKWAADLRLSVPVSKEMLLSAKRLVGFKDEEGYLEFGEHLAARAGRPALHDFLSGTARIAIDDEIRASKSDVGWWARTEEVRWLIEGDRLKPKAAKLLVMTAGKLDAAEEQRWVVLSRSLEKSARLDGIRLGVPVVLPITTCTAALYRSSVEIFMPSLRS